MSTTPEDLRGLLDRVVAVAPPPSGALLALSGALALALVVLPGAWPLTRHAVTLVHEAGHALVAVLVGRRLTGVRLHADTSGLTLSRGRPRGPGMVATVLAGYPAPALLGLAACGVLSAGRPLAVLAGLLLVVAVLGLAVRNLYGVLVVVVGAAALAALGWWGTPAVHTVAAHTATGVLLLGAPRAVLDLARTRRRGPATSDADVLARLTPLPALVWVLAMLLATAGAAVLGVRIVLAG